MHPYKQISHLLVCECPWLRTSVLRCLEISLKVDLSICEIFHNENTQLFTYYSKTKGFYGRIIIKQFKIFSHKISQIGKSTFMRRIFKIIKIISLKLLD